MRIIDWRQRWQQRHPVYGPRTDYATYLRLQAVTALMRSTLELFRPMARFQGIDASSRSDVIRIPAITKGVA